MNSNATVIHRESVAAVALVFAVLAGCATTQPWLLGTRDKPLEVGTLEGGLKEGRSVTRYLSGKVASKGRYVGGKRTGKWIFYHPNGAKRAEFVYRPSNQITSSKYWDGAGQSVTLQELEQGTGTSGCDKNDIAARVRASGSALVECYTRELQSEPRLKGTVTVQFRIEKDGRTTRIVTVKNTLRRPRVVECIRATLARLSFPMPDRGICVIEWPFVFRPPR